MNQRNLQSLRASLIFFSVFVVCHHERKLSTSVNTQTAIKLSWAFNLHTSSRELLVAGEKLVLIQITASLI